MHLHVAIRRAGGTWISSPCAKSVTQPSASSGRLHGRDRCVGAAWIGFAGGLIAAFVSGVVALMKSRMSERLTRPATRSTPS